MIAGKDIYEVIAAIIPLYVSLLLGFSSVRFFSIFTADQCSGINRFVAVFAVPLLSFHFISTNNPYAMNYHFLAADSLQKIAVLTSLSLYHVLSPFPTSLDWTITLFSLSTLPNTLVMGIPLLRAMYGDFSASLMVQIVVLQSVLWYTIMLFFFEYRAAKSLIADQFPPEIAASIASFHIESDVVSLAAVPLHAEADIAADGRLRVVVRHDRDRTISNNSSSSNNSNSKSTMTPRASNLTGVEIYSLQSSREPTPRGSSFDQSDLYSMLASAGSPAAAAAGSRSGSDMLMNSYLSLGGKNNWRNGNNGNGGLSKELHMYVWSASSASPASEANLRNAVNRAASAADFGGMDQSSKSASIPLPDFSSSSSTGLPLQSENASPVTRKGEQMEVEDGLKRSPGWAKFIPANGSPLLAKRKLGKVGGGLQRGHGNNQQMPPTTVMTRLILIMVWRKLIRNPNTYSSLIGLVWSLVSFRCIWFINFRCFQFSYLILIWWNNNKYLMDRFSYTTKEYGV